MCWLWSFTQLSIALLVVARYHPRMNLRLLILGLSAVFFAGGCSSFNRDWKKAADQSAQGVEGRWIGRWHSDHNQHNGALRCLINRNEGDSYETRFHAKYKLGILTVSFPYDMEMTITSSDGKYIFMGEADLGRLAGGLYKYDGAGTTKNLAIKFRSPKDHGTFRLQRPEDEE
jgi:hypothetical protein|tara:strand:+ start:250 stop:768 length:519 start_codon:yes stop_codon:yes gene_type:complete